MKHLPKPIEPSFTARSIPAQHCCRMQKSSSLVQIVSTMLLTRKHCAISSLKRWTSVLSGHKRKINHWPNQTSWNINKATYENKQRSTYLNRIYILSGRVPRQNAVVINLSEHHNGWRFIAASLRRQRFAIVRNLLSTAKINAFSLWPWPTHRICCPKEWTVSKEPTCNRWILQYTQMRKSHFMTSLK